MFEPGTHIANDYISRSTQPEVLLNTSVLKIFIKFTDIKFQSSMPNRYSATGDLSQYYWNR